MLAFSGKKFLVRWFSTNVYAGARAFLGKSNFLFGSGYAGLGKGHATARLLLRNGRVYHLFSRLVYRAIGRENLRNRREHGIEHIRSRLIILDFVLAHLDCSYLETEHEKILYFCGQLSVPKQSLPTKHYIGAIHKKATERYFVDKFPVVFRPDSTAVNFTFIDPGWQNLASCANRGKQKNTPSFQMTTSSA